VNGGSRRHRTTLSCRMQHVSFRRRSPRLGLGLSATLLASVVGAACVGDLEPCPGVQKGAAFEIEVLGSQKPDPACHDAYGFKAGTLIVGTIADTVGEADCEAGVPGIERVGDWSLAQDRDARIIGGHTLEGRYTLTNGSCAATLWLILRDDHPLACDASRGERCSLETRITPIAGDEEYCPGICDGQLSVRAQRL
jgi:hypothetical protein